MDCINEKLPDTSVDGGPLTDGSMDPLHVVTCISNPVRFHSRYRLYKEFAHRMAQAGVPFYTVELALRDRAFHVTQHDNPRHLQIRHSHELWHKENMLQLGIQRLVPWHASKIAIIDADIAFTRPDWALETAHQLEHYKVVQMFAEAIDLGPSNEPLLSHTGFVKAWTDGVEIAKGEKPGQHGYYPCPAPGTGLRKGSKHHPGYAWAFRREALDAVGGLIDWAAMGSGDYHMACGLVGQMEKSFFPGASAAYKQRLRSWEWLAEQNIRRKIGYVDTTIFHYWHGKKRDRGYDDRWKGLRDNQYDPNVDIIRDSQGVIGWAGNKPALRDFTMRYLRSRNEDSIDLV